MSSIDSLDALRKIIGDGMMSGEGHNSIVSVPVNHLQVILRTLNEQEVELRKAENTLLRVQAGIKYLEDSLSYTSIEDFVPPDSTEDEDDVMYEVYLEGGRLFAFWCDEEGDFYRFVDHEDGTVSAEWLTDVTHWRAILAEPNETLDLTEVLFPVL